MGRCCARTRCLVERHRAQGRRQDARKLTGRQEIGGPAERAAGHVPPNPKTSSCRLLLRLRVWTPLPPGSALQRRRASLRPGCPPSPPRSVPRGCLHGPLPARTEVGAANVEVRPWHRARRLPAARPEPGPGTCSPAADGDLPRPGCTARHPSPALQAPPPTLRSRQLANPDPPL